MRVRAELIDDPDARIAAAALVLPHGAALGGWAAARLHGDTWSDGRSWRGEQLPVPVVLPHRGTTRHPGLDPVNARLDPGDLVAVGALPVTSPRRTAFDLARLLPAEPAVAAVDALLATKTTTVEELTAYVESHPRMKGVPQAREVVGLVSPYAESPQESRMRLRWRAAGAVHVQVNARILDERGVFVARVDLLDEEAGLVGEYQGDVHRGKLEWRKTLRRTRRLQELGLIVVEAVGGDLEPTSSYSQDLRAARARGLRRDRSADRWQVGARLEVVEDLDDWLLHWAR